MHNKISTTFVIVSPMFIGDAHQQALDIRPPSIKGALRFWWRALNWDKFYTSHKTDEAAALRALHKEEARLFGIATNEHHGGQGVFLLCVSNQKVESTDQPFSHMTSSQLYLLGMGLGTFKDGNKSLRTALKPGGTFSVELLFRPNCNADDQKSIADALYAFGLFGALGSRARHGMGSVAITGWEGLEIRTMPTTKQAYLSAVQELVGKRSSSNAPFTAFTQKTRIDFSLTDHNVSGLLDKVGKELQMYRSFGRQGKVLGQAAEQNFKSDHDLLLNAGLGERINESPKRLVFGLPHHYFFSSIKAKVDVDYMPNSQAGRRASPLFLHIHPLDDVGVIAMHSLFPADFLPKVAKIRIKSKSTSFAPANADWQVIHHYLDRFKQKETIAG